MPHGAMDVFCDQVERLLVLAHDERSVGQLDSMRASIMAVRQPDRIDLDDVRLDAIGRRLLAVLYAADFKLPPEQVAELEALIQDQLGVGL
jgi:hypothetical protein